MVLATAQREGFAAILAQRGDSMLATLESPWLRQFAQVPDDAAPPLAMSPPHPRAVGSYGPEALAWCEANLKIVPRWWQALAITRQLEHDADGELVWREIVESGPRRIGKSVRLRMSAVWRCAAGLERFGETQLAMLVSKDLAVGKEIHRGSWRWCERNDWNVVRLGGAQEIESPGGDRWLLRAPNAVYGYDVGYGQVDESWGVSPAAITDGLEPALLERMSPQLHLTSTAHVRASSLMRRRLTTALRSADPDILLLLWGAHPEADIADRSVWRSSSPHWSTQREELMARKYAAALAGSEEPEFDDPDPVRGWAAQYLNLWPLLLGSLDAPGGVLPGWGDLATRDDPPVPQALGIAADLERSWISLAAYGSGYVGSVLRMRLDGRRADFLAEVVRISREHNVPVGVDGKGPANVVIDELEDAGVDVRVLDLADRIQADADFKEAVDTQAVCHGDHDDLNAAVVDATWRKVGERLLFGRSPMLEAASISHWVADQAGPFVL